MSVPGNFYRSVFGRAGIEGGSSDDQNEVFEHVSLDADIDRMVEILGDYPDSFDRLHRLFLEHHEASGDALEYHQIFKRLGSSADDAFFLAAGVLLETIVFEVRRRLDLEAPR